MGTSTTWECITLVTVLYLRYHACNWYIDMVEQWPDRQIIKAYKNLTCPGEPEETNIVHKYSCQVGSCPSYKEHRLDMEARQFVLDWHNAMRNLVATGKETRGGCAKASNMMVLNYDMDLEYSAVCFARRCAPKLEHCRKTKNFFKCGQNVYEHSWSYELQKNSTDFLLRKALDTWYEEINFSTRSLLKMYNPSDTWEHFTQIIWHSTTHVGCARVNYKRGPVHVHLVVCNYGPEGNIQYLDVYNFGIPRSECPDPFMQNNEYEALCGRLTILDHKHRYKLSIASHVSSDAFVLILLFVCTRF